MRLAALPAALLASTVALVVLAGVGTFERMSAECVLQGNGAGYDPTFDASGLCARLYHYAPLTPSTPTEP